MVEVKSTIEAVKGFQVAGVHCGLKKEGKLDFALIVSDAPCTAAGVFTTNQVKAAPVQVGMRQLNRDPEHIRAVAINTGCANACTGQQGIDNALQTARWVAEHLGCDENEVLVLSTGVIGTQLPMDKLKHGIELAVDSLGANHWEAAARAIMTTDTRPKMASVQADGYQIAGVAKGAGMIAPNMATMLGVVVTNTLVPVYRSQKALLNAVNQSFNKIVVDGDMSTNDTVLLLANGESHTAFNSFDDYYQFQWALNPTCEKLAKEIVRDGEGATKFITIAVDGAADNQAARKIADTIATSPLVKTAFFGEDANWGRILAAVGRAGVPLDLDRLSLRIKPTAKNASLQLIAYGEPTAYSEEEAASIMRESEISILIECGIGEGSSHVWTCDLSHDYVSINGSYRS